MKKRLFAIAVVAVMTFSLVGCGEGTQSTGDQTNAEQTAEEQSSEDQTSDDQGENQSVEAEADENGNYVVNGSFEAEDFTGWNINNIDDSTEELDVYTVETDAYEGAQSLHFYSGSSNVNFTAEQTIEGLEAGSYKMTAHVQGDAAGDENAVVEFYAVVDGEKVTANGNLGGYVNWDTVELPGLKSSDGTITVGVSVSTAPGGWGTIDDITLVKE